MAAACHINGKPVVAWTRQQLETMGRPQLWRCAQDLAEAMAAPGPPPRHREVCIEWMLDTQLSLPSGSEAAAPEDHARTATLRMEEMRPEDHAASRRHTEGDFEPATVHARARAKNQGYGLGLLKEDAPAGQPTPDPASAPRSVLRRPGGMDEDLRPTSPPGPIDDAASVALRAKARNAGSVDLFYQPPGGEASLPRPASPPGSPPQVRDTIEEVAQDSERAKSYRMRNTQGAGNVLSWT